MHRYAALYVISHHKIVYSRSTDTGMGPLMRDVKNKICTDCDLIALLEDDTGMEVNFAFVDQNCYVEIFHFLYIYFCV